MFASDFFGRKPLAYFYEGLKGRLKHDAER